MPSMRRPGRYRASAPWNAELGARRSGRSWTARSRGALPRPGHMLQIEPDQLRASQRTGEADQQERTVADAGQAAGMQAVPLREPAQVMGLKTSPAQPLSIQVDGKGLVSQWPTTC